MAQDWKLIGILTGATLDCGPQPGRTSSALGWPVIAVKLSGRGVGRVVPHTYDKNTSKCMSRHYFLRLCLKFKKIQKLFQQEKVFF